tara:strand:+ start:757 stop:912 length:156 start_codon:yes stop_codon:yes gene_type:complete
MDSVNKIKRSLLENHKLEIVEFDIEKAKEELRMLKMLLHYDKQPKTKNKWK